MKNWLVRVSENFSHKYGEREEDTFRYMKVPMWSLTYEWLGMCDGKLINSVG